MTGLTKMYCYRMFRQKSLYIIWAVTVVMILLNLQMIEQRTFSTLLCESGTLVTMLSPLFTAIFFSADHSSGFIKNYAGSVSDKTVIIAASAAPKNFFIMYSPLNSGIFRKTLLHPESFLTDYRAIIPQQHVLSIQLLIKIHASCIFIHRQASVRS